MLLVAACGGSTATNAPGATQAPGQPTAAPATQPPAATQSGGGSGYSGNVCDLISTAEIESIMGVAGATSKETPISNGSGSCYWLDANGDPVIAIAVQVGVSLSMVQDLLSKPDTVLIPGVGDGAGFVPSRRSVFVVKNGTAVEIQAGGFDATADFRQAKGAEFAKVVAARL
jgi:hypothetical protein